MPGLTSLISPKVMDLFRRSDAGDPEAKVALRAFQDSPELTNSSNKVPGSEPSFGYGPEVKENLQMDSPGLGATSFLERLSAGGSRPALGATPTFAADRRNPISVEGDFGQRDPKRFLGMTGDRWKQVGMGLQSGISGYLQAAHPGTKPIEGGFAGKWREEQANALKQRQGMWDTAYTASQQLPAELLVDAKYASLAQAKAALDRDMQDGKVDNEKNVSGFLTELARFKPELDQYSLKSKVNQQLDMEGQLKAGREQRGLTEALDYNFEGTPTTRTEYLARSADRTEKAAKVAADLRELNLRLQMHREEMGSKAQDQTALLGERIQGNAVEGYAAALHAAQPRYMETDPETGKPALTNKGYMKMLDDHQDLAFETAQRLGIDVQHPNYVRPGEAGVLKIQGRSFNTKDPKSMTEAMTYLDRLIQSRRTIR